MMSRIDVIGQNGNDGEHYEKQKGLFIVLEGIDGSGKTTAVKRIVKHIESKGFKTFMAQGISGPIRDLIVNTPKEAMDPVSRFLLFAAFKRESSSVIKGLVNNGVIVVCDRFTDSSLVCQGLDGVNTNFINSVHDELDLPKPDLTILMDMSAGVAMNRLYSRELNSLDVLDYEYLDDARVMFYEIAEESSKHVIINAEAEPDEGMSDELIGVVDNALFNLTSNK